MVALRAQRREGFRTQKRTIALRARQHDGRTGMVIRHALFQRQRDAGVTVQFFLQPARRKQILLIRRCRQHDRQPLPQGELSASLHAPQPVGG